MFTVTTTCLSAVQTSSKNLFTADFIKIEEKINTKPTGLQI